MNLFRKAIKHCIRLNNTISRRLKMISLKCQYGNRFKYEKFHFRKGFHVYIEDSGSVSIGKNCFFNHNCSITVRDKIFIGENCIFGENVKIYDHNHKYKDKSKLICEQGFSTAPVIINHNCWIGSNVTILKGVTIGENSVIGAGVVVHKNIPENSVVINQQDNIIIKV